MACPSEGASRLPGVSVILSKGLTLELAGIGAQGVSIRVTESNQDDKFHTIFLNVHITQLTQTQSAGTQSNALQVQVALLKEKNCIFQIAGDVFAEKCNKLRRFPWEVEANLLLGDASGRHLNIRVQGLRRGTEINDLLQRFIVHRKTAVGLFPACF